MIRKCESDYSSKKTSLDYPETRFEIDKNQIKIQNE